MLEARSRGSGGSSSETPGEVAGPAQRSWGCASIGVHSDRFRNASNGDKSKGLEIQVPVWPRQKSDAKRSADEVLQKMEKTVELLYTFQR